MLKLEHITKTYRTTDVETLALDDVCLTVNRGEFLAIMGASGSRRVAASRRSSMFSAWLMALRLEPIGSLARTSRAAQRKG